MRFSFQNDLSRQLNENIGEAEKLQAWKYRISLVLEENEFNTYISGEVPVPEGDEANVDVIVTSECIHLYFVCIVHQCLFWDVSVMYLSHVMPQCSDQEIQ